MSYPGPNNLNPYLHLALSRIHVWVAPLRIETGRYEMMPYDMRSCFTKVESEEHVLLECPLYNDILVNLEYYLIVLTLSVTMIKICHLLSNSSIINYSAKA